MPNGMTALAQFYQGAPDKPVILILHGFLQTSGFSTVQRLMDTLVASDYSVLSPSLSLGIDRRKTSLSCEAIHIHSLDEETQEIQTWIKWLKQKNLTQIVLLGHSFGSLQLLAYQNAHPEPGVIGLILTSLVYVSEHLSAETLAKVEQAANSTQPPMPQTYQLAFCKKYPTLPQNYWSYLRWNKAFTTQAVQNLKVPTYVIIGTQDNRIDTDWLGSLAKEAVMVHGIEGANHLFDAEHEFDLHNLIEELLQELLNKP